MAGVDGLTLGTLGPKGTVVCLGAHCDDIEIGCGATLIGLRDRWPALTIHCVIFCSDERREAESRESITALLGREDGLSFSFGNLRDGYLPYGASDAKQFLVDSAAALNPDLIFSHNRADLHQDHRFVGELALQVFRTGLILEMEIPKYDGDLGKPSVYFPASQSAIDHKLATLLSAYPSQREKDWFSEGTFRAIMRLRGIECRSPTGMAEAFFASKLVVAPPPS